MESGDLEEVCGCDEYITATVEDILYQPDWGMTGVSLLTVLKHTREHVKNNPQ